MSFACRLLPRTMRAGPIELDLFFRDGRIGESWLSMHPREFELIWRLAEMPRQRCSRKTLLRDVWRLHHVPETNTLEVHVHRLRQRLAPFGCDTLIATDPAGGYRLEADVAVELPARICRHLRGLDSGEPIGDDAANKLQPETDHEISG